MPADSSGLPTLIDVSRETHERLAAYVRLLTRWSKTLNLISKGDMTRGPWQRHIVEALQFAPHLPPSADRFIDLGSGAGLPGIPIAMVTGHHVDLVESDQRKAAFLETALATLEVRGTVWSRRIEVCGVAPASCVTARALAPLSLLLAYAHPLLDDGGIALFSKGHSAEMEIVAAQRNWHMEIEIVTPAGSKARILRVSRLEPRHDGTR